MFETIDNKRSNDTNGSQLHNKRKHFKQIDIIGMSVPLGHKTNLVPLVVPSAWYLIMNTF